MTRKLLLASMIVAIGTSPLFADDDYELRINGDFRGAQANSAIAPGWTIQSGGGSTRIVPGGDFDEFAIEVNATAQNPESVLSDLHPVVGNALKIESELKGTGVATIGFIAFDAGKNALPGAVQSYQASAFWSKTRNYFTITNPDVKFVKIVLTAGKGSSVTFADVEAEFKRIHTVPAGTATPTGAVPVVLPPASPVATATVQAPTAFRPLIHDKYYSLNSISNETFQATVPLHGSIDFELEEDADKGFYWTIASYDAGICRVEMEHDRDGIWPFRYDQAEIELKGIAPGTTTVVFTHPNGKNFKVQFTVR